MQIHVFQTGRLIGNRTFLRGERWSSLLRRAESIEFPVLTYVIEHPDGLVAIDTGMGAGTRVPFTQRRFVPQPVITAADEIGPQMRARGLRTEDVRHVVLTHLDWDHAGGLRHFPQAEVFVHRPEHEFAGTLPGRMRYRPADWPQAFSPTVYDLADEPCGAFPQSRELVAGVRVVSLSGHSAGQVGVIVDEGGRQLFFVADHVLRQDWFLEDLAADRLLGLGIFFREQAIETSRRLARFVQERTTVLLPSHDAAAPARLAGLETVAV